MQLYYKLGLLGAIKLAFLYAYFSTIVAICTQATMHIQVC